jgi:flagellar biosynthesis anti-sigma factor FlgM
MEVRNGLDSLKTLLGVSSTSEAPKPSATTGEDQATTSFQGDRATFSCAGSEISQSAIASDVRSEKVASIQAALEAGIYHVPASAVASKLIDSMLAGGQSSEN